jgi:hypothetical protein
MKKIVLIMLGLTVSCATAAKRFGEGPEDYYNQGMADYKKELWPEAQNAFSQLKSRFPYSKYAALAEVRIADIKLASDKNIEAADGRRLLHLAALTRKRSRRNRKGRGWIERLHHALSRRQRHPGR